MRTSARHVLNRRACAMSRATDHTRPEAVAPDEGNRAALPHCPPGTSARRWRPRVRYRSEELTFDAAACSWPRRADCWSGCRGAAASTCRCREGTALIGLSIGACATARRRHRS